MSNPPLVSVIVTTFNRGPAVAPTIESALLQSLPDDLLEVLVVDDGSSDGTWEYLQHSYAGNARLRLIRRRNGGVARARNRGLQEARGQWIAFLDHDDIWLPPKLEALLTAAGPETGVMYSRWHEVDESGTLRPENEQMTRQSWWRPAQGKVFPWLYGWRCPIVSMSVPLVRRDVLLQIGGFDPRCVPADDWDVWLRLARVTRFAFVDEPLTHYTVHAKQQRLDQRTMFRASRRVLTKYPLELVKRPLLLWWLLWTKPFEDSLEAYEEAKISASGAAMMRAASRALQLHPLSLLAPQWITLIARRLINHFQK